MNQESPSFRSGSFKSHFFSAMKIQNKKLFILQRCLLSLEGYQVPAPTKADPERCVLRVYNIKNGSRAKTVKALRLIQAQLEEIEAQRLAIVAQFQDETEAAGGTLLPTEVKRINAREAEFQLVLAEDLELPDALRFYEADLDLDANPIPQSIVLGLDPLIISE